VLQACIDDPDLYVYDGGRIDPHPKKGELNYDDHWWFLKKDDASNDGGS